MSAACSVCGKTVPLLTSQDEPVLCASCEGLFCEQPPFPPPTLEADRDQWTPRDKLARLVTLSRHIGYWDNPANAADSDLAEERALFEELAERLGQLERLYAAVMVLKEQMEACWREGKVAAFPPIKETE